jgi:hypothetical protein
MAKINDANKRKRKPDIWGKDTQSKTPWEFQSKIPKMPPIIAPITPKIAPKMPAIIPTHAPARPTTNPKRPPANPIQIGKVNINRITINVVDVEEVLVDIV